LAEFPFFKPRHITSEQFSQHNTHGVSKKFGEWYQKTNKTEDTNKLTLLAFKIIAIAIEDGDYFEGQ
jgi:hypothetical protein